MTENSIATLNVLAIKDLEGSKRDKSKIQQQKYFHVIHTSYIN